MSEPPVFEIEKVFDPDDYLHFYAGVLTPERAEREIGFIEQALGLERGMRILDLCCGHGRLANPLAQRGYQVTGVDITPGFLELARKEASLLGVRVEYVEGDMRQLPYKEEFDRVINCYTSFGYFGDEENLRVLEGVARALKPEGRFLLEIQNRDWLIANYRSQVVLERGNDFMIDLNRFDPLSSRNHCERILIRDGRVKRMRFSIRLYTLPELEGLLSQVGLKVAGVYGDYDLNLGFGLESPRMIVIAQK